VAIKIGIRDVPSADWAVDQNALQRLASAGTADQCKQKSPECPQDDLVVTDNHRNTTSGAQHR